MEDKKEPSSLPANYVTLVQLQERWVKEKERKLKEKEQQEKQQNRQENGKRRAQNAVARISQPDSKSPIIRRLESNQKLKEKEQQEKQQKQQEKGKCRVQNAVARISQPDSKSPIIRRLESNQKLKEKEQQEKQQKQQEKGKRRAQKAVARISQPDSKSPILHRLESNQRDKPEASVSEVKIAGDNKNVDQEGKSVNSKNKKRNRKKKNHNLAIEDEVTEKDGVVRKPPANEEKEDMRGARNRESRGMEGKIRAKSSNSNQTKVEIETKFRDFSVNASNGNEYKEMKRTSTYKDHGKREFRDYGFSKSYCPKERKPRDGLIWVKKGELFDGHVCRLQTLEGSHYVSGQ